MSDSRSALGGQPETSAGDGTKLPAPASSRPQPRETRIEHQRSATVTLSPGLPAGAPVMEHGCSGADRRARRSPGARRWRGKRSDKASTATSSVWDTRPWARGSSSAVAGAARMLRSGHTEVGYNSWVLARQTSRKCGDGEAPTFQPLEGQRAAVAAGSGHSQGGSDGKEAGTWSRGPSALGGPTASIRQWVLRKVAERGQSGRGCAEKTRTRRPRGTAMASRAHAPLQGRKLEALHAELDEGSQVCLADPADGVDVSAGAVVLGQVAKEAAARERTGGFEAADLGVADSENLGAWPSCPWVPGHAFFRGPGARAWQTRGSQRSLMCWGRLGKGQVLRMAKELQQAGGDTVWGMTSASPEWCSFNQARGGCKVTPCPVKRTADGTNGVRSVGKGQDFQARRDGHFHLTPVPLPVLDCSQRCTQSSSRVRGHRPAGVASGGAGSPPG